LAKQAFSKPDHAIWQGPLAVLKPGLTERAHDGIEPYDDDFSTKLEGSESKPTSKALQNK
jgi:hypothetical protein